MHLKIKASKQSFILIYFVNMQIIHLQLDSSLIELLCGTGDVKFPEMLKLGQGWTFSGERKIDVVLPYQF